MRPLIVVDWRARRVYLAGPQPEIVMLTFVIAVAGFSLVFIGYRIMVDFTKLQAALGHLSASVQSVADAIRNPAIDNAGQATADEMADRLDTVATSLEGLAAEETAEDTAGQVVAEPPASDPIEEAQVEEQPGE